MHEASANLEAFLQVHERYHQVKYLSQGSFGKVILAQDKVTGGDMALKFIQRGPKITKYVSREIENQLRLRHPHIIGLKEVLLSADSLVLVMEYASGGDLLALVCRKQYLHENEARWYLQQILFAVDYCHQLGIVNRDIKLENTLLHDTGAPRMLVKLADFGFSKDENCQSAPGTRVGTPAYLAPEVIMNRHGGTYDGKKADVWSIGVLLYTMVTGQYPFQRSTDTGPPAQKLHASLQRILNGTLAYPRGIPISDSCKDLIARILVADPLQRPSVQEVLRHPWTVQGLSPSVLSFNEPLVARSRANPPSPELVAEVRSIVQEARFVPRQLKGREHQQEQRQEERQQQGQGEQPASPQETENEWQAGQEGGSQCLDGGDFGGFYDDDDIEYHPVSF